MRFADTGFGELRPGRPIGPARWTAFDLLLVHRGRVELSVRGELTRGLTRGHGVLLAPQTGFAGSAGPRGARISVQHFVIEAGAGFLPYALATLRGRAPGVEDVRFDGRPGMEGEVERCVALAFAPDRPGQHDLRVA